MDTNNQSQVPQGVDVADEDTVTVPMSEVQIDNEVTNWTINVPSYEVGVLQLVHGDDRVEVTDEFEQEYVNFDPDFELQRIQRKYGKNGEEAVLRALGADSRKIAELVGVKSSGKVSGKGVGALDVSVQRDHSVTAKEHANTSATRGARPVSTAATTKRAAGKGKQAAKPKSAAAARKASKA